jgi:hypothetical protein
MRVRRFVLWSPASPEALSERLSARLADGQLVGRVDGLGFSIQRSLSERRRRNPFALTLVGRIDPDPDGSAVIVDVTVSLWLPFMVANLLSMGLLMPLALGTLGLCFAAFYVPLGLLMAVGSWHELRRVRGWLMTLVDPEAHFVAINEEARPRATSARPDRAPQVEPP